MKAHEVIDKYLTYFEKRGHKRIPNSPLVPQNDPTTLFTSSGMQPLLPYLLGQEHPEGTRLVDVQNCFRAVDIEEIGDNRHTTFFRMLGNWSLGNYFKKEELPWLFEFLTVDLNLPAKKLYVTVFAGDKQFGFKEDTESISLWQDIFKTVGIDAKVGERIFPYGVDKNWWSRSGRPDQMPVGEPGGPSSEVFYDYGDLKVHEQSKWKDEKCHVNCDCGRYVEIGNSVFMQYIKESETSFKELPQKNVDFGGGLERLMAAMNNNSDVFQTNLLQPIIQTIEEVTKQSYEKHPTEMRIIADHLLAAVFITNAGIKPSKTDQGYILRRLIRRSFDNINVLRGIKDLNNPVNGIIRSIVEQYKETDPSLVENFVTIENTILEEINGYRATLIKANSILTKKYKEIGDELMGVREISAEDAFNIYTSHGLSPTQIKSLGYTFDDQAFAEKMKAHKSLSRKGAEQKFKGGLADHEKRTIMGHTATHLLHQALRDVLGDQVHQSGSNITTERVRFDFNYDKKLTDDEIKQVEKIINHKIKANLPVHYEIIPTTKAYEIGAIGLFMDTYGEKSKIYFIGDTSKSYKDAYSIEFCGGPHVDFTGELKSFKIIKQENLGKGQKRLYGTVEG